MACSQASAVFQRRYLEESIGIRFKFRVIVYDAGSACAIISAGFAGKMVFNRKDYGMNKGIPFIKIADHVDVNFHLKEKRVSGPPLAFKQ